MSEQARIGAPDAVMLRSRPLWTVERELAVNRANTSTLRALPGTTSHATRRVGFSATFEDAQCTILGREVELYPVTVSRLHPFG